jgi:hypothetical protein
LIHKFSGFKDWNASAYNKSMESLDILLKKGKEMPVYMQTGAWDKKTLNTSLGYWSLLKHDVVLFAKQGAAEAGEGGGPGPPVYPGYVEPDVKFWKNCNDLLDLTAAGLRKYDMLDSNFNAFTADLKRLSTFFQRISKKELNSTALTYNDFDSILWIGGKIETITEAILHADYEEGDEGQSMENYAGVVADVFTNKDECLEEATGWGDYIYVVAEINGYLYITRGAVFSYCEFRQPASDRLTDEEWHKMMEAGKVPKAPEWMQSIMINIPILETKPWYTYAAQPVSGKYHEY